MAAINYKGEPVRSDAKWYFDRCSGEADIFDGIFFEMCKRFNVRWSAATPKEKLFIEGITRFEYEWDCLQILLYNVLFVRLISIVLFVRLNSTPNRNLLLQITVFSIIETFH